MKTIDLSGQQVVSATGRRGRGAPGRDGADARAARGRDARPRATRCAGTAASAERRVGARPARRPPVGQGRRARGLGGRTRGCSHSPEAEAARPRSSPSAEALAALVRRRQRRQHLLPPRRERRALHADAGEQGRPAARGPVPGRPRRQPARRHARAHQRDPDAPRDLQGRARGEGASCTATRRTPRPTRSPAASPDLRDPRVRGVRRQRGRARAYETPGTQAFADAVLPFVQNHNTMLLQNHGIVCWADTVTHAEWYAEVVDTYCWTLMLAPQLGAPITHIPQDKAADLLAIKKRLGLPDSRLDGGGAEGVPAVRPAGAARGDPMRRLAGGRCTCGGTGSCARAARATTWRPRAGGDRRGDGGARRSSTNRPATRGTPWPKRAELPGGRPGAESGRVMVGRFDGERLDARRRPTVSTAGPVRLPDGLHTDVLRIFSEIQHGLAAAAKAGGEVASVGVDTWGVDFALLDEQRLLLGQPVPLPRQPHRRHVMEEAFARVPRQRDLRGDRHPVHGDQHALPAAAAEASAARPRSARRAAC